MKIPTSEEVAQIKADAMKRFGRDRALLVQLDAPIDAALVVAPFDLKSWDAHVDAQKRDVDTANASALVDRLLWPSLDEAIALRSQWPATSMLVMDELLEAAGQQPGTPRCARLSDQKLPRGLSPEKAAELLAAPGAPLWSVELAPHLSCVMRQQLGDVYLAARATDKAARAKGVGIISAVLPFVLEAVVWSATPTDALLDQAPALAADLRTAYFAMGGEGAATRSKSL